MMNDSIALRDDAAGLLRLSRRAVLSILSAILVAAVALFHLSALRGWWGSDDPQVLLHARHLNVWQIFFSPHHWRILSSSNFTPLVTLSFKIDLLLFGLSARAFFLHQLIAIAAASLLVFALIRRYAGPAAGVFGGLLFIVSPQTILLARSLMLRHYLEGLVLALAALLVWDSSRLRKTAPYLAALLYLAALCAKEIYAPLPLFFLFLSWSRGDRLRNMIRDIIPASIVALLYLMWRRWMLGSVGGYGAIGWSDVVRLPRSIWSAAYGDGRWLLLGFAAVVVIVLAGVVRPEWKRAGVLLFVTAIVIGLPLVPVAGQFESRYAMAASTAIIILIGIAAARSSIPGALWLYALLFFPLLAAGQRERILVETQSRAMTGEGRYVFERPATSPTLMAQAPAWYLEGLARLRHEEKGEPSPPVILSVYPLYLTGGGRDIVRCVEDCQTVAPIPEATEEEAARRTGNFQADLPVRVAFSKEGDDLHWKLEPPDGQWVFLTFPHYDEYSLASSGWRRLPENDERQFFRLYHEGADGRWTITPPLEVPRAGHRVVWQNGRWP